MIFLLLCCALGLPPDPRPKPVEAGVELRWRFEARDNADQQRPDDFDRFLGHRLRAFIRLNPHPRLSFYLQGQDVWIPGARNDRIIHDFNTNLHQAYFDWRPAAGWEFRGGRQELSYGDERLVGVSNWDNVGRSWDGARLRYRSGPWTSDFFGARLVDVRRNGAPFRPAPQDFYGAHVTRGGTDVYGLFLHDHLAVGTRPTRIGTFGFRHARPHKQGWRYSVENAWQVGDRGQEQHRAMMAASTTGYTWSGRLVPRAGIEYDFATGDGNPRDGVSHEFHNLFPTNHGHYGYADVQGLRNVHAFRLTAGLRPHARVTLDVDYWNFLLADRRGPWKNDSGRIMGQDATGRSGRHVGQELDFTVRVPVHAHFSLQGGYSAFLPGAFARRTRGPETHHFAYMQSLLTF